MSGARQPESPGGGKPEAGNGSSGQRVLTAVKGVFSGEYTGARGAMLVIVEPRLSRVDRIYAIVAGDGDEFRYQPGQEWKSFESQLINSKLQGSIAHQMTIDVQAYIKKVLQDDLLGAFCDAIQQNQAGDVRKILSDILSRAIADSQVLMQIDMEKIVEAAPEGMAAAAPAAAAPASSPEAAPAAVPAETVRIRVEPVLSPVQGVPANRLTPGMTIMVEVRDPSTIKQNVAKMLSTKTGAMKGGPIEARVMEVTPSEYERVQIVTQLAQQLMGISHISGELRVKVSDASLKFHEVLSGAPSRLSGPAISSRVFFWSSVAIVLFMFLLAWLVFGGVIGG